MSRRRRNETKEQRGRRVTPKNQTSISQNMENKIISMYAKGMSTSDIEYHIRDIYGL